MSALTRTKIEALLRHPPARRTDLPDGQLPGLTLRVTPSGTMTWSMQYRLVGAGGVTARGHKLKGQARFRVTIGRYPALSIAEAREAASKVRAMAERGENPQAKLEREATAGTGTVKAIADEYLEKYVKRAHLRTDRKIRQTIEMYIIPRLGNRAAASVSRRDVVALMEHILPKAKSKRGHETGGPEAARTAKQVLHRMFEWACRQDILAANPVSGVVDPFKMVTRDRVLTMEELRAIWRASFTLEYPFGPLYRLLLLTGCRRGEWAGAKWSWLDQVAGELHIPAESYKTGKAHIVALTHPALETLAGLTRWNGGDHLFSGTNGEFSLSGFSRGKKRLGKAVEAELGRPLVNWRPHDFRRSVATHLRRLGVDRHVVKRVLGHAERDVTATYDRYNLLAEARTALELWAKALIPSEGEIVQRPNIASAADQLK